MNVSIIFMTKLDSSVCIGHNLYIHSSVDCYLNCVCFLVIMSNAAMNIFVQVFVCMYVFF